ncbi:AI-2E family transporter [Clostridium carnis]
MKEINSKLKNNIILATYIIILLFILLKFKSIVSGLSTVLNILSPFIVAIAIAFILNIPMNFFENKVFSFLDKPKFKSLKGFKRSFSILTTIITVAGILIALILFIIPQLIDSMSTLIDTVPSYVKSLEALATQYISSTNLFDKIGPEIMKFWKELLQIGSQLLGSSLSGLLNVTINFTTGIINFFLSLVLAIYMLSSKETLIYHLKKVLYAFIPNKVSNYIINVGKITNVTFYKFIAGQCTEAVIIGVLCFVGMVVLSMPYPLLISVIVSVTSLIPIFGAFIGTIPSAFIILIIDPMKAFWFIIFILVLQQFEGNIIYPRVVGNSVGLSAIWVMLAMLVGGSTMGLIGMLIGIPTFSVLYQLLRIATNNRIKKREVKL